MPKIVQVGPKLATAPGLVAPGVGLGVVYVGDGGGRGALKTDHLYERACMN